MIRETMLEVEPLSDKREEIVRIEKEIKMHVPEFVSKWPAIDPEKAADFALENNLVSKLVLKRLKDDNEGIRYFAAKDGLRFCRDNDTDIKNAYLINKELQNEPLTVLNLFDMFANKDPKSFKELEISEGYRRARRDREILTMETDLLRKRGVKVPNFENLIEYCEWLPEKTGHNKRIRKGDLGEYYIDKAHEVYWDLMGHYSQTIEGAKRSFDPLHDWEKHFKGKLDITKTESWYLQNMGKEDIGYYAMAVRWGGGARTKPSMYEDPSVLITHSTSFKSAEHILQTGYLTPRVCYSVGRVVSVGARSEVTFIFDKRILRKVYSVESYRELSHEEEIRSNELNNINFAIGCVPTLTEIFFDYHGRGEGTQSIGGSTIKNWEEKYKRTGRMWSQSEIDELRDIAGKIQRKTDK